MVVRVDFVGLKKVIRFVTQLPRVLDRETTSTNEEFMRSVWRDARRLSPKDTRTLMKSITLEATKTVGKTKQQKLVVLAPYGIYQEEGFTPHFAYITRSNKLPVPGIFYVSKFTPFVGPAVEKNLSRHSQLLADSTKRAIRRASR